MSAALAIAGYALRESLRRRVLLVVMVLTLVFGVLDLFVSWKAFQDTASFANAPPGVDTVELTGATLIGLCMFGTMFLGAVLGVFLTLGAVRGDAERGVLQPIVVRPVGRTTFLAARGLTAAAVCALYVAVVYAGSVVATGITGGWWPSDPVTPGLYLVAAVTLLVALSVLGSVVLSPTANGIAMLMLFGLGLIAGLLGEIGRVLPSATLSDIAHVVSWALPFEALYQAGLSALTVQTQGVERAIVSLGPFGGAHGGDWRLALWAACYLGLTCLAAGQAFLRRDL
jgi:ABC-type transport system involved in multi-copper enzyme maturation permease subunit